MINNSKTLLKLFRDKSIKCLRTNILRMFYNLHKGAYLTLLNIKDNLSVCVYVLYTYNEIDLFQCTYCSAF